jgi:hypothetical protein
MQKILIFLKLLDKFDILNYNCGMIDKLKRKMTETPLLETITAVDVNYIMKDFWRSKIRFFEFTGLFVSGGTEDGRQMTERLIEIALLRFGSTLGARP